MKAVIPSNDARRLIWALPLLLAASAACSTSFAQTITETTALPAANDSVLIGGLSQTNIPGASTDGVGSLSQSGVLPNGTLGTAAATLSYTGATAQVTNSGEAEAVANFYLMVSGPTPTVQLTLSNALLSTSGVNTSLQYGGGYQIAANLNITQTPNFQYYTGIVGEAHLSMAVST